MIWLRNGEIDAFFDDIAEADLESFLNFLEIF